MVPSTEPSANSHCDLDQSVLVIMRSRNSALRIVCGSLAFGAAFLAAACSDMDCSRPRAEDTPDEMPTVKPSTPIRKDDDSVVANSMHQRVIKTRMTIVVESCSCC